MRLERYIEPFVLEAAAAAPAEQRIRRGRADLVGADRARHRRGEDDRRQDLALPARRDRARRRHPRLGADRLLRPRTPAPATRSPSLAVAARRAALLERRRRPAADRGAARQGARDGHAARLHDERRRALAAGDDPAAARPAPTAARDLRRRRRRPGSSRSASSSTPSSERRNDHVHDQGARPRLQQLPTAHRPHRAGARRTRPPRAGREGHRLRRRSPPTAS